MPDYHGPLLPNEAYHICNHANGFENLFVREENYDFFLRKYTRYANPVVQTYAYCLLPNHFHFLVRVRGEEELLAFWKQELLKKKERKLLALSNLDAITNLRDFQNLGGLQNEELKIDYSGLVSHQFAKLFLSYSKAFNKQQNRRGSLFIPNFKRSLVGSDAYFYTVLRYIHQNPVRHGLRKELLDWPHSSIHAYYWADRNTKLEREAVLDWFGGSVSARKKEFWAFHNQGWELADLELEA